jgi:tripartite-type tricarboxylate transporter receptor subunit TctC
MQHVPYRGSAPALADVIAGNITFMFDILVTAMPTVQSGRVKALAVTSDKRSPYASSIPTMAESGVKGFSEAGSDLWFGIVAPAGLPKPITARLNELLITTFRSAQVRERVTAAGFELWTSTPEEFSKVIASDRDKWNKIVKAAGAKID